MMGIQIIFRTIWRKYMNQDNKGQPQHGAQSSKDQQGQQPGQKPGQQQGQQPGQKPGQQQQRQQPSDKTRQQSLLGGEPRQAGGVLLRAAQVELLHNGGKVS